MHPTLTRYAVRNCLRSQPTDYVRPSLWHVVREFLTACLVLPLLWLAVLLMGPNE